MIEVWSDELAEKVLDYKFKAFKVLEEIMSDEDLDWEDKLDLVREIF